jgi:hypothetical protein
MVALDLEVAEALQIVEPASQHKDVFARGRLFGRRRRCQSHTVLVLTKTNPTRLALPLDHGGSCAGQFQLMIDQSQLPQCSHRSA